MSIFTQVQNTKVRSNTFDLSHDRKMSLKMGELTPILVLETVPGDKFRMSTSQLLRMAPMISPVMHQITCYTHFFFVPNRILWPNWENFITGGEDGLDASVYPYFSYSRGQEIGSLSDYLGLPIEQVGTQAENTNVSAYPFAAYQKIYNEFYRDQNLIDPVEWELEDGANVFDDFSQIRKRAWQHDYFTSALPWTQKGPEATLPLGSYAPIEYFQPQTNWAGTKFNDLFGDPITSLTPSNIGTSPNGTPYWGLDDSQSINISVEDNHRVDLSEATSSTINDLRNAFRLQEWLEKNARGGSRYIESILSHFGVKSSDARLQRPEFLGGGASPVTISEVLQTSTTATEPTPQGNMAGHGISAGANDQISYYCEEHGYIIGIMSILPKTAYQQGIPKHWLKFDKFDYYWPSFAHLGEQPIENKEIYLSDSENEETFGYTPRYAEYKFINSSVHGEFRTTLDIWHMGRKFATRPALNQTFIEADPTTRIFAVEQNEQMYAHIYHKIKATRKMPYFGTPKF